MKIDIHNHPDWHGHNIDDFIANMDLHGIDKTVLLSWEAPESEYDPSYVYCCNITGKGPISFERCLSYVEKRPDRFILGYCPDPRDPKAVDQMKAALLIYKAKICGELKLRMMYDNPDAIRLYRYCGEAGLPVTVHIDYEFDTGRQYPRPNWWYGGGIDAFERAVKLCPETIFFGHAPGFWAHISNDGQHDKVAYPTGKVVEGGKVAEMLRKYKNLNCDMSAGSGCNAFSRDKEHAYNFIMEFQDRICYARDYFDNIHQELLESLNLPQDVLDKIYCKNAQRLIKGA